MKGWGCTGYVIIIFCMCFGGVTAQNTADWAYQISYSPVDLIGKNEESIGYRIVAPITYPNDMVNLQTGNETRWNFDMGKAGEFVLQYIPSPVMSGEDEYFQIHERDISFLGNPFNEDNLYYDGTIYSCWGEAGENKIRYDCARFIDGHFFKLSCVFNTMEEALRYNQKLREIIKTIEIAGNR